MKSKLLILTLLTSFSVFGTSGNYSYNDVLAQLDRVCKDNSICLKKGIHGILSGVSDSTVIGGAACFYGYKDPVNRYWINKCYEDLVNMEPEYKSNLENSLNLCKDKVSTGSLDIAYQKCMFDNF